MKINAAGLPPEITEQAADWIVMLTYGTPAERKQAQIEFEAWQQRDPRHAEAAASLGKVLGRMDDIRAATDGRKEPAHAALTSIGITKRKRNGKRIVATLALLLACAIPSWMLLQYYPPAYLMADLRSSTGQSQTTTLADGTRLTLRNASAVNLRFDHERRALQLIQGEIMVQVAPDAERPFIVETEDGSIRALGTQFIVDRDGNGTLLSMLESRVAVQTAAQRTAGDRQITEIHAGQQVRIHADRLDRIENIDPAGMARAWDKRQLVVRDRPLTEVLDELNRHRPGRISYDHAALADIRMAVVLPLDDTDRALQLLVDSLPALRVRTFGPWLVRVDKTPPP